MPSRVPAIAAALVIVFSFMVPGAAAAASFADQVNSVFARSEAAKSTNTDRDPRIAAIQVMLDRAGFSVGVIDGYDGENFRKAVDAYRAADGLEAGDDPLQELWNALDGKDAAPALKQYTITEEDVAGPFVDKIPEDYAEMAEMDRLAYTSVAEMLAERFHMDIDFLSFLNTDKSLDASGTSIWVADTGDDKTGVKVERIVVDVSVGKVTAYDADGNVVTHYPATIGSAQNPSPSGTHEVTAVAIDPTYTYDPSKNFQQGDNTEKLVLPAGPNGPVGSVWIDLSEPTYGLHGTPEPALIDKSASHGCVRLTNWDARELAETVVIGATVEFSRN